MSANIQHTKQQKQIFNQKKNTKMAINDFERLLISDIKVAVTEQFDQNFVRGGFFGQKWQPPKYPGAGTTLVRTGELRRSIKSSIQGRSIIFGSHLPQAKLHNQGGQIEVSEKMKRFFFYKASQASNQQQKSFCIGMALKKAGDVITIPQRQFLGAHSAVDKIVNKTAGHAIAKELAIIKNLKR